ncbi:protease modulator HflC [Desulfosarcina sp. BuS5]|uniref:protease modulator HflC n=1 Tax=Desulfosarcina sp. BuS5 TaxID=933262 RepID=UPI000482BF82|nr:protease modulator HflC [Desulfosarcina sp. BuS5]
MKIKNIAIIVCIVALLLAFASAYTVSEIEQVVITQFGEIKGDTINDPGLHFKIPIIQQANYFPKNLLEWDGDPGQIPTLDKTYIWVDTFARWKITDPVKFFQTVNNTVSALGRLDDIIDPSVRNFITSYRLIETVRTSNRKLDTMDELGLEETQQKQGTMFNVTTGREKITRGILKQASPKLEKFGIKLVDVQIKRINYVEQVRNSVYERMVAERNQIAEKFRSEGMGEARKIFGEKERDLKKITSQAYKTAQEIKGKADAGAVKIFAKAYSVDPEFYSFTKTLEIYNQALGRNSSIILSTDSEFFKYFKGYAE